MAILLTYSCACGHALRYLQDAQDHCDETGHEVNVRGSMSSRKISIDAIAIEASAERKLREGIILRLARDRGLLPQQKHRPV